MPESVRCSVESPDHYSGFFMNHIYVFFCNKAKDHTNPATYTEKYGIIVDELKPGTKFTSRSIVELMQARGWADEVEKAMKSVTDLSSILLEKGVIKYLHTQGKRERVFVRVKGAAWPPPRKTTKKKDSAATESNEL